MSPANSVSSLIIVSKLLYKTTFCSINFKARQQVNFITMDISGPYILLTLENSFPNAKIVLDRFHIVQHLSRAMNRLRIKS